jgi:prepilin signal peptidase PulO-like enzyme (type II secretory pathway)
MSLIFYFFIFIFGLIIGSFLNCLVWRLHEGEGMWNRSYCPKCRDQIAWYDNIPVFSFIFLGGRCRHCSKPISWQYPIVELVTGILFVLAFLNNESRIMSYGASFFSEMDNLSAVILNSKFLILNLRDWFVIAVMIVIFIYDFRWYLILDEVSLPACSAVLIFNLFLGINWLTLLISALVGGGFFLLQFVVSRGKWIGGGDIRLGLLMGLSLGRLDYLLLAILLAYFIGSFVGLGLIIFGRKKWDSQIPLGVFLSISTIFVIFWGEKIINWYFGFF